MRTNAVHSSPQQKGEDGIAECPGYCSNEAVCRRAEKAPQKKVGLEVVAEDWQGIKAQPVERFQVPEETYAHAYAGSHTRELDANVTLPNKAHTHKLSCPAAP